MNESGVVLLLHLTARCTFVFFFCAFTGNALRDLWPGKVSQWLARSHDYFLVAQAASHTVHLGAILAYFQLVGWSRLKMPTLLGGGFVYLLIYALAAAALVRLFSGRQASLIGSIRFEGFALYVIWLVFALAFVPRIVSGWPVYSLFGLAAIVALTIRITCKLRHNRAMGLVSHRGGTNLV
jgi:membrane-bound acyltransferase YfiQ involved in biofilm formation